LVSPPVIFFFDLPPVKYFFLIYPPKRPNKNEIFLKNKIKLVFVWPIRGVNQNKNILKGGKSKKYFTGGKQKMTYITGGKDLLTLFFMIVSDKLT